ncbi:MAG: hypothetical protein CBC71_11090 [Rhodobacteraceae bacterium TMED111]|nr:MAG: hypothetical protein CBC71_11090 [Rhodobacteraceae bacterium TMED111]BAR34501.1 hypothetical protein [uncultured Mediterranean phage uvMED]
MKLRDYLIENFMTQAEFAEKIGTKQPVIHKYIYEKTTPGPSLMKKIFETTSGKVRPRDFPSRFKDGKVAKN